jgi:transcriptional regulator with XRE-family HTH domain
MHAAEVSSTQRRRLRSVLRQLRSDAGMTQEHVANEMDWSLSKVIRIETGAVSVSVNDVRALLNLYSVMDKTRVAEIIELARVARLRPWWYAYRDHYSQAFQSYLDLEAGAKLLKFWQPSIVPGLLQTEAYARAAVAATASSEEDAAGRVDMDIEVRQHRQRAIFDQPNPPQITVVLEEPVLLRMVGGAGIMRDQIRRLQEIRELPHVTLRVLPLSVGVVTGMFGQFIILEFEDEDDPPVVYVEGAAGVSLVRAEHRISDPYERMFDRLFGAALDENGTDDFLRSIAQRLG